jgi:hypothetical protein
LLRKLLLATLFLLFSKGYLLYAQNQAVLQKEANTYYLHKDYAAALPAYRQLLAKDQLNPEFNFRYGHCLYEIENKDEAAKYFDLLISRSLQADPLLYYFRARIYQHQYFFSKAKSCYEQYQKLTIQDKNALPTTELLNQCKRGVEEVQAFQTLPVLDQKEVKLAKFYQHYSFSEEGYSIYEAPDFLPKYNAKKGFIPIYCYKRGMKYRIVAAHDDSPNQLELFIQKKDANNNWGVIQKISGEVNSAMNEAYAFYDEPSQTLYFSSEANSIGGYDIFQAKFNLQTGQSTDLEKLKYPYASPDDDLFYVIDREQNKIFFTSNRNNAVGSAEIYTLELGKEISAPFIFAGNFKNIANPNQAVASISFVSLTSQIEYGPFVSQADGAYLIALPPKENYTLVVRQEGAATAYRTHFTIPNLTSEQLLNQQITYQLNEFGKEQYVVINRILPKDAEKQVDLLAQAQVQLKAQTLKAMQPAKYTASAASSRSPLFSQFTWAQTDTLEFVTQITDSLLAAEVSLENQVRLSEVLRNAFELKLAQREKLLSKGPSKELDQLNKELALIKEWLEVNQAANIPNMELLAKIQAVNEKAAAYLHNQQQIELLKSWEAAQLELAQFLQIAAYDGQQALQLAQQDLQLTLQATSQQLLALKSDKSEYQKQLQQLEKNLSLQSKKEQALTQARIDELKSQIAKINSELTVLEQHRDLQVKQLAIFDQPELIEEFISRSENQSLPELEISETLTEMLAQYEQQQILVSEVQGFIQSSNQGSNEISNGSTNETRSSNQASNEKSSTNQSSNQTSNEGSNEENLTRANEGSNGIPNGSTNEARSSNQSSNKGSNEENRARANGGSSEVSNGSTNETRSSNQASNETSSTNQSSNQTSNKGSNEENLARANEVSNEISNGSTNETRSSNQSSNKGSNEVRSTNQTKEIEAELKSFEEVAQQILENNTDQIIAIEAFPSLVKTRTELETLEASLALPVAKLESAPELKAEQWETYLAYLKARDSLESAKQRYLDWNTKMQALELAYLENPSPETLQEMKEVAQNLQEVAALKVLQQELLKVKDQAQFEALFNLGYLPPYELKNIQAEANNGTVFSFNATPVYEQIQIGLPCPKGLVFRVQVGAFRKPIPAGRFTEFKPVDGRILANGLTVVMAGYFKNSAEAVEQRDLIRKLGYADAFVVAYNGCERMNMSDAQRLEVVASGGTQSVKKSIFAGPGMQLFYTVQVGVYNRPLISEKQLGLPELIEAQTAKGQYRYASGRFDNLVAAKERQKLAVKKGITDAFIIAYYQGKRISLAEAKQLQLQGIAMQTTIEKTPESKPAVMTLSTMPKLPIKNQLVPTEQEVRFEQKCFTCQDRLADLNHYGVFTYLPEKAMISSAQFKESELNTLQRYYLKSFKKVDQNWTGPVQTLQLDPSAVSGAQMDWLLRQNQPYRILKATQDTYQIEIQLPK